MKLKHPSLIIMALCMVVCAACGDKTEVPQHVGWADVKALLMEDPVNAKKVAAYAEAWQNDLTAEVEKYKTQNDDAAKGDLKNLADNSTEVLTRLNALAKLTEGDTRFSITSSALKVKNALEDAAHYLGQDAAPAEADNSAPDQPAMEPGSYHMSFSDGTYFWQSGSYPTLAEARSHHSMLIMKASIPGKGIFYRTIDGPYEHDFDASCDHDGPDSSGFAVSWHTLKKNYVCFIK